MAIGQVKIRRRISREEADAMLALYAQGWNCMRIAKRFNRSRKVTYERIMRELDKRPLRPLPVKISVVSSANVTFWTPPLSRLMAGR